MVLTTFVAGVNTSFSSQLNANFAYVMNNPGTSTAGTFAASTAIVIQGGATLGKITVSTSDATGGSAGDLWLKY